ncbi:atherin-like [Lutra lutra]|uniref:atherin-like n=1 Tax=Lutra lutra TaxID=9657 RepID=UPI001FD3AF03|nr:atherin-like [Lutra lutra]
MASGASEVASLGLESPGGRDSQGAASLQNPQSSIPNPGRDSHVVVGSPWRGRGRPPRPQPPPPAPPALPARSAAGAGRPSRAPRDAPGHGARRALRAARTAQDAASLPFGRPAPAPAPPRPPEHRGGLPRRWGPACGAAQDYRPRLQDQQAGASGVRMVQVSPVGPGQVPQAPASVSCSARGPAHRTYLGRCRRGPTDKDQVMLLGGGHVCCCVDSPGSDVVLVVTAALNNGVHRSVW